MEKMEVQLVMQEEMIETLENTSVPGSAAGQVAQRLEMIKQETELTKTYLNRLKEKYGK